MSAQTQIVERESTFIEPMQQASRGNVVPIAPQAPARPYPPKMVKSVLTVTREIGAVAKEGWNDFHKYKYLKWDDILDRLSVLLPKNGLIVIPSEVSRSLVENDQAKNDQLVGITYEFIIVNDDGDEWPMRPRITAFGRVRDSKNICDDKAAVKCLTQAEKYFLIHFFKIRTSDVIDSDADSTEVPAKQIDRPKPPRPGSPEAKAADEPCAINPQGMSYQVFADTFIAAIERSAAGDVARWVELNQTSLDKVKGGNAAEYERIEAAIKKLRAPADGAAPKPPKPPRPGASAAPAAKPMPDATANPEAFITWLTEKMDSFDTYEAGESYWNDTIEALDLSGDAQEEAMGVWRRFERRFEG